LHTSPPFFLEPALLSPIYPTRFFFSPPPFLFPPLQPNTSFYPRVSPPLAPQKQSWAPPRGFPAQICTTRLLSFPRILESLFFRGSTRPLPSQENGPNIFKLGRSPRLIFPPLIDVNGSKAKYLGSNPWPPNFKTR